MSYIGQAQIKWYKQFGMAATVGMDLSIYIYVLLNIETDASIYSAVIGGLETSLDFL